MSNSPIGGDSPSSGAASRLKSYKNKGLDSVELRRQREEEGVQLRKQKRDEQLSKRRNVVEGNVEDGEMSPIDESISSSSPFSYVSAEMIAALRSDNPELQLSATQRFRKILSRGSSNRILLTDRSLSSFTEEDSALNRRILFIIESAGIGIRFNCTVGKNFQSRCADVSCPVPKNAAVSLVVSFLQLQQLSASRLVLY